MQKVHQLVILVLDFSQLREQLFFSFSPLTRMHFQLSPLRVLIGLAFEYGVLQTLYLFPNDHHLHMELVILLNHSSYLQLQGLVQMLFTARGHLTVVIISIWVGIISIWVGDEGEELGEERRLGGGRWWEVGSSLVFI